MDDPVLAKPNDEITLGDLALDRSTLPDKLMELAQAGSPEAIEAFAAILADSNADLIRVLLQVLHELAEMGNPKPLYEVWLFTRGPRVTAMLTENGWIADFAAHLKVLRLLEEDKTDEIMAGGPEMVDPLINAAALPEPEVRQRAVLCLQGMSNPDTVDTLCDRWARTRSDLLAQAIQARGLVAARPAEVRVLTALLCGRPELPAQEGAFAIEPLVTALRDANPVIAAGARTALLNLENQDSIDELASAWVYRERSSDLGLMIQAAGYIARKPPEVRVMSALKSGREQEVLHDGAEMVQPLVYAAEDADPLVSRRAKDLLERMLEEPWAQEALCRVVIEHGTPGAARLALSRKLSPRDVAHRALFFFLTEQWAEYESLDYDMSLLRQAYGQAGKDLRARIAGIARQAGRLELVELVAGMRHKRVMGQMTAREWDVAIRILDDRRDCATMWRLAQTAPAVWSVRGLLRLMEASWEPDSDSERQGFRQLSRLALECKSEAPVLGFLDRPVAKFQAHGRRVTSMVISSYFENTLATAGWDGLVRTWRIPGGEPIATLSTHGFPLNCLASTPDGSMLAAGSGADQAVLLWAMPDAVFLRSLPGHGQGVGCLAASPDGRLLAAGCYDSTCKLWRLQDGILLHVLRGHTDAIRCAAFSPDGGLLATGGEDWTIRLWNVPDGRFLRTLSGHRGMVKAVVFSPDGRFLAGAGSDEDVLVWGVPDGEAVERFQGHNNVVSALAASGDGRVLAAGSWDRTVRLWTMPAGRGLGLLKEHSGPVTCLATDPESRILVSGGHDCAVVIWNFQSGILRRPVTRPDMDRMESLLAEASESSERTWMDFLHAQMRWRWRHDIEIATAPLKIQAGDFDIEVEG